MTVETLLAMYPGIRFSACHLQDGHAMVDLLSIPLHLRRRGLASAIYRAWESTLPDGMTVSLFAIDADASAFWRTLGFCGRDNDVMTKHIVREMALAA